MSEASNVITDREILKKASKEHLGDYREKGKPSAKLANRFLLFKSPRKKAASKRGTEAQTKVSPVSITIRVPYPEGANANKANKTKTFEHKGEPVNEFIDKARRERDGTFKEVYGMDYNAQALKDVTPERKCMAASGVNSISVDKALYRFKVHFTVNDTESVRSFTLSEYGDENTAFIEACRFNDCINGKPEQPDEVYLAKKPKVLFPDFATPEYEERLQTYRDIKESVKINKRGVEVACDFRVVGFYMNYSTELGDGQKRGQRRNLFNARTLGEDKAFVKACQERDKYEGNPIQSDKFYLSLKPVNIFKKVL